MASVASWYGLGRIVLRLIGCRPDTLLEIWVSSVAVGMVCYSILVLGLGLVGFLYPGTLIVLLGLCILLGLGQLPHEIRADCLGLLNSWRRRTQETAASDLFRLL